MKNLRVKIQLGSFQVEIEGDSTDVSSQLEDLKQNGLGQMVDQLVPIFKQPSQQENEDTNQTITQQVALPETTVSNNTHDIELIPTLHDIVFKMLPKSESEWILIYGHYLSENKKQTFTRDNIVEKYEESKRRNTNTMKNLSSSIKSAIKKGWISALNDKEFIVTPTGSLQVNEILSRADATEKTRNKATSLKE